MSDNRELHCPVESVSCVGGKVGPVDGSTQSHWRVGPEHNGRMSTDARFEQLIAEGNSEPTEGWDFSWFDGRATEERPSWRYSRELRNRIA